MSEKQLVEENGQTRETTTEEVDKLRQNPDKLVTETTDGDGNTVNKVQGRLLG